MKIRYFFFTIALLFLYSCKNPTVYAKNSFVYKQNQTSSALKGFISWEGSKNNDLPCTLAYVPIKFYELFDKNSTSSSIKYDFSVLENKLDDMKGKGLQSVIRIICEEPINDPSNPSLTGYYVPSFINVSTVEYLYDGKTCSSPNYSDESFVELLIDFITAFGKTYNGDSRIACVQTGLIGHWGEWHTWYCEVQEKDAMPTGEQQKSILDTFSTSFSNTCVCVRIPTASGTKENANIGIYNDMFYSDDDDDYMKELFNESNIWDRWQNAMITGEFAPPLQKEFIENLSSKNIRKFKERLKLFHNSSMLMSKLFFTLALPPSEP